MGMAELWVWHDARQQPIRRAKRHEQLHQRRVKARGIAVLFMLPDRHRARWAYAARLSRHDGMAA